MKEIAFINQNNYLKIDSSLFINFIIENKSKLFDIERNIKLLFATKESYFSLLDNGNPIDIEDNVEVIDDIFTFDINDKKILNMLYKNIKIYCRNYLRDELNSIKNKIEEIIGSISLDHNLDIIATKEIKEEELFKLVDLKINDESDDRILRLIKYIKILYELKGVDIFFTFRLHEFFDSEQIKIIFNELKFYKISIINIEANNLFEKLDFETNIIYDNDLSLIMWNVIFIKDNRSKIWGLRVVLSSITL